MQSFETVAIVGAGWTGRQIAGQMLTHGLKVLLCDPNPPALAASKAWILENLQPFSTQGYWPSCAAEQIESQLRLMELPGLLASSQKLANIELVLESVPEQAALKRRLLKQLSEAFPAETILASNSSYFVPSTFSKHLRYPQRYAHFHFHVPIWKATVVDVAAAPETDPKTLERLSQLAHKIGQTPIVQTVENSGYIFNAMLKTVLQSALQLHERGIADPACIDLAWTKATGMPVGPFGIMDQIGLDIMLQTMSNARFVEGDHVWLPLMARIEPLVAAGHLGVKTGQGFFSYPRQSP
jgi:3-hydroxybutyryl-CoA dehydrogenase